MFKPPYLFVQDNFLSDPDHVRKIGLELCHETLFMRNNPSLPFRGLRNSRPLDSVDKKLCKQLIWGICKPLLGESFTWLDTPSVQAYFDFQLTDKSWSTGWVHTDTPNLVTSILYLSPDADPESGTNLYKSINPGWTYTHSEFQKRSNASPELRQTEEYRQKRDENNAQFVETASIKNVYNRMVTFPAATPHAGHYYFGESREESRLALVTFIEDFGPKFS
jgi:hypothetical protein